MRHHDHDDEIEESTAQTRGHFYEMNQALTFMNDFRRNHAWLSLVVTHRHLQ